MRRRLSILLLPLAVQACSFLSKPVPRYEVFFIEGSSQLEDPTYGTISEAASAAVHSDSIRPVHVIGYSDSAGSPKAGCWSPLAISVRSATTAEAVMALVADGVPPDRIVREVNGPTGGDTHVQRRRVEITIGP